MASKIVKGARAAVPGLVVPGSTQVKLAAEAEGLDRIFRDAGFTWGHSGCSMCVGMNGDLLGAGTRCASTSNRNAVGRQGKGSRTHLVSPAMAAPFDQANVDTGLILPARYLRRPRKDGFQNFLFRDMRFHENGSENLDFVLNQAPFRNARILVADRNFGEIFALNAFKGGLLPVQLDVAVYNFKIDAFRKRACSKASTTSASPCGTMPRSPRLSSRIAENLTGCSIPNKFVSLLTERLLAMPFFKSLSHEAGPPAVYTKYPAIYEPWSQMSQATMNGPSPLSQGEREFIFAYAAGVAGCEYVYVAHSEVAYAWGIERGLIERLLKNPDSTPVDARLKPILAFVRKLMLTPNDMSQADADAVFAAGWEEQALQDAIAAAGRAAFMQRLVSGHGFIPHSREEAAKRAKKRIEHGYVNLYPAFRKDNQHK